MSVFGVGVILVCNFSHLDRIRRNMEYPSVFNPNAGKCAGKMGITITPNTGSELITKVKEKNKIRLKLCLNLRCINIVFRLNASQYSARFQGGNSYKMSQRNFYLGKCITDDQIWLNVGKKRLFNKDILKSYKKGTNLM